MTFLNLLINPFFINFVIIFFFVYIKITEHLSVKLNIIKKIKKDCKKTPGRYQNLSKEEKEKCDNMAVNVTKISQKMKTTACSL